MTTLRPLLFAACLRGCSLPMPVRSQEAAAANENHPAVKVVNEYLKCMLSQDWESSSKIVETKSLEDLRDDYVKRVKGTATLDEEKMVVEKFKVKQIEDVGKLSGADFYIAYHKLLKDRSPADATVLKKVRDSMKLRILSVAAETDSLVHVLVRTKHNNDKVTVESLEIISLIKVGDKWMVGLNEQTPKITPLAKATDADAPASGSAPAAPEPAVTPEAVKPPVKPAVKPPTKAKGK